MTVIERQKAPARALIAGDYQENIPVHVVWELTLACTLRCGHCGSRAGAKRPDELTTDEALALIDEFAAHGTREVTIIGGEAFLRKDWLLLIEALHGHGIYVGMQSGAYGLSRKMLEDAQKAGLQGIGVSIDGLEALHDSVRRRPGSFVACLQSLADAKAIGLGSSVNTQIGAGTIDQMDPLLDAFAVHDPLSWQIQLTVAMGNAVDNPELLLQPHELLDVMPELARLKDKAAEYGVRMIPGNNIGYFGPFDHILHTPEFGGSFGGCGAGRNVVGVEADGTIKGCPSLNKHSYGGGTVRERRFAEIWAEEPKLAVNRRGAKVELSGYCAECYYADVCRGGCTWTADSLLGHRGNNPYCHYRTLKLAEQGLQEEVRKCEEASDEPFAVGRFELVRTPISDDRRAQLRTLYDGHWNLGGNS